MSLLNNESIIINRQTETYDENGRVQDSNKLSFNKKASIQPLTGQEVLQLSDGDRKRTVLNCFTTFNLIINDEVVTSDGLKYESHPIENWARHPMLKHYKVRLILKERQ